MIGNDLVHVHIIGGIKRVHVSFRDVRWMTPQKYPSDEEEESFLGIRLTATHSNVYVHVCDCS